MACPYFYPTERLEQNGWPHPSRLPLGDGFAGTCRADPAHDFHPSETTQREYCNLGYARGHCYRFPQDGPDAVRFTVAGEQDGRVQIDWVLEKGHRPYQHGLLEYDAAQRVFLPSPSNPLVKRQAEAYVESYLRRKAL